jgi:hypothetical protein
MTNTIILWEYSVVECRSLYKRNEFLLMGAQEHVIKGQVPGRNLAQTIQVLYITQEKQSPPLHSGHTIWQHFVGF